MNRARRFVLAASIALSSPLMAQINISVPKLTDVAVSGGYTGNFSGTPGISPSGAFMVDVEAIFGSDPPLCSHLARSREQAEKTAARTAEHLKQLRDEFLSQQTGPDARAKLADAEKSDPKLVGALKLATDRQTELARLRTAPCTAWHIEVGFGYSQLLTHGRSSLFTLTYGPSASEASVYGWIRDLPSIDLYLNFEVAPSAVVYFGPSVAFSSLSGQFFAGSTQVAVSADTFAPGFRAGAAFYLFGAWFFAEGTFDSQVFSTPKYSMTPSGALPTPLPNSIGFNQVGVLAGVEIHLQD